MHVHLEPFCGASGDMLLGALVDAGVPVDVLATTVEALGLANVDLTARPVDKMGIAATHVAVTAPEEARHRHLPDIEAIITAAALPEAVKARSIDVFRLLAEAEGRVHGIPPERVHFHEVGALDAIVDVVGVIAGFDHLGVTTVSCRAVPLSHGTVRCAHGVLPVPAPAVLRLIEGLPTEPLDIDGETVTPTAAALLRVLVDTWTAAPAMRVEGHGYGAGSKTFARANVLRLTFGERVESPPQDTLVLLSSNIDDMNPEWLPAVMERLLEAGARDAWLTPILMKKGRPAHTLSVLADQELTAALRDIVYAHTTSLGVRQQTIQRHRLARATVSVETRWGPVQLKVATLPDGALRAAPEYDDCRALSESAGVPLQTLYDAALAAWHQDPGSRPATS